MRGRHILIALAIFVGWVSPTLADTVNSFRKAHGLPALHRSGNLQARRSVTPIAWRRAVRWITTDFTRSEVRAARELKMWPMDARSKAARCACGRIPVDTAPTCCSLASRVTASHQRVVAAIATGV